MAQMVVWMEKMENRGAGARDLGLGHLAVSTWGEELGARAELGAAVPSPLVAGLNLRVPPDEHGALPSKRQDLLG